MCCLKVLLSFWVQAAMTKLEQRVGQAEPMGNGNAQDDDHEEAYNDTLPVVLSIVAFVTLNCIQLHHVRRLQ